MLSVSPADRLPWQKLDSEHYVQTFNIGHYMQTVQPIFFIPAMLIGTFDHYKFILLSLTLTLPRGHKVSTKQNLLASFSPTLFI